MFHQQSIHWTCECCQIDTCIDCHGYTHLCINKVNNNQIRCMACSRYCNYQDTQCKFTQQDNIYYEYYSILDELMNVE